MCPERDPTLCVCSVNPTWRKSVGAATLCKQSKALTIGACRDAAYIPLHTTFCAAGVFLRAQRLLSRADRGQLRGEPRDGRRAPPAGRAAAGNQLRRIRADPLLHLPGQLSAGESCDSLQVDDSSLVESLCRSYFLASLASVLSQRAEGVPSSFAGCTLHSASASQEKHRLLTAGPVLALLLTDVSALVAAHAGQRVRRVGGGRHAAAAGSEAPVRQRDGGARRRGERGGAAAHVASLHAAASRGHVRRVHSE